MKHTIRREIVLNDDEIRQAIVYWLREFCDKPTPDDRDKVILSSNAGPKNVTASVSWSEDISEK